MEVLDNKENICVRCDLPKTGQKGDNNNIIAEHANGEVNLPDSRSPGNAERRPVHEDAEEEERRLRGRRNGQEDDKVVPEAAQAGGILSEDEISSNSDDCVYTYRGGRHLEAPMRATQEAIVDDTDFLEFLEMDFDPEPSSEQDNYPENNYFPELDGFIANLQENNPLGGHFNGFLPLDKPPPAAEHKPPATEEVPTVPEVTEDRAQRNTGAKPKVAQPNLTPRQKKSPPVQHTDAQRVEAKVETRVEAPRQLPVCLECAEMEFLSETSQNPNKQSRRCTKHSQERPKVSPERCGSTPWESTVPSIQPVGLSIPPCESRQLLTLNLDLPACQEKVVKISSVGCTEEDVVECLSTLGVQVNRPLLQELLRPTVDVANLTDLTEFLIHISKSNCDYRKLIDAIRAACDSSAQDLQFSFEPSQKVPELIKVSLTDIGIRWNPNTSLRDLMNLPNKYFHSFNVVGKIANAVRQLNTPREGERRDHILVPNFYRSGLVVISRRK